MTTSFCRYPLVLITIYNILDLISGYIPLVKCLKLESRKGFPVVILARFLFIPAFYFTAKYGDQGWMMVLVSFLGLSHGYLIVCVMMVAPKGYKVGYYQILNHPNVRQTYTSKVHNFVFV